MADASRQFDFSPPEEGNKDGIQMAPLIDIVFLLICFYIFVGELVRSQKDITVELPKMASTLSKVEAPAELIINIRPDGKLNVNGKIMGTGQLGGIIKAELLQSQDANESLRVIIRAHRKQQFELLDSVMDTCRKAGLKEIIFRAEEGAG